MNKIELLNASFKEARINKNTLMSNLYSTFKGEFELSLKNGNTNDDDGLEKIAKKMIKSAELVGSDESRIEIEALKQFVSEGLSREFVEGIVKEVLANLSAQVEEYKAGKTALLGRFVGECMKKLNGKGDAKVVTELIKQNLA